MPFDEQLSVFQKTESVRVILATNAAESGVTIPDCDHVIDLGRIGKPERVLREASMLCNPRTPASVLRSTAKVSPWTGGAVQPDGSNAAEVRPAGLALVQKLNAEHASTKVLRLSGVPPDYRAVLPANQIDSFEQTMKGYAGLWCCNRPPGGRGAGHSIGARTRTPVSQRARLSGAHSSRRGHQSGTIFCTTWCRTATASTASGTPRGSPRWGPECRRLHPRSDDSRARCPPFSPPRAHTPPIAHGGRDREVRDRPRPRPLSRGAVRRVGSLECLHEASGQCRDVCGCAR